MQRVRVGCTGWGYDDWRGGFYPPGAEARDYLALYARAFDATEVDSSYYAAPTAAQTARWASQTPEGFLFAPKLPGEVTHRARLRGVDEAVDRFLSSLGPLRRAGRLGPVLLQLPASFTRAQDERALLDFVARFPRRDRLCVELRHRSWFARSVLRALEEAGATLVWAVTEHGRTPPVLTSDLVYLRLVVAGARDVERFDRERRDAADEMAWWRDRLLDEGAGAKEVMVFVNNHLTGFAPAAAQRMRGLLGLPPADAAAVRRPPGQRPLPDAPE